MRAPPAVDTASLLVLIGVLAMACAPPATPEPPTQQQAQEGVSVMPAGTPRVDDARTLVPLTLPELTPAAVYTRTAPASLVDERGTPLQVLTGHHTRLELLHAYKDRAHVACTHCPTPAEGWVQRNLLMPADHEPSDEELADERLSLALYVAGLRRTLEREGSFPDLQPGEEEQALLLRIMDQGFVVEEREAMAPASGGAYARDGTSIRLRRGPETWRVKAVELPASGAGGVEDEAQATGEAPVH